MATTTSLRTDSIFQDNGSINWSVLDTPQYKAKVAREDARWEATATPREKARYARYLAGLDAARAAGMRPGYGEEAQFMVVFFERWTKLTPAEAIARWRSGDRGDIK